MVNTQHIGAYIKALRLAAKLSQHALAKECGVSRVAVTKWESGDTKNLKLTNLIALQRIFDISFDCLLLGDALPGEFRRVDDYALTYRENGHGALVAHDFGRRQFPSTTIQKTVDLMARMSAEDQSRVYGYASGLAAAQTPQPQTNKVQ